MSLFSKLLTLPSADKKNSFSIKRLYTYDALSSILFWPITAWLFPIVAPFPELSILTIPLDKCQMKSFENINILIKVKVDLHSIRFSSAFASPRTSTSCFICTFICLYPHSQDCHILDKSFAKKMFAKGYTALF